MFFFQFLRGGLTKFVASVRHRGWVQMERQQAREDLDRLWDDYKIIQRDEVLWGLEEEEEDAGYFFVDPDDTFCLRQLFGMEPYPEAAPPFGTEKWNCKYLFKFY